MPKEERSYAVGYGKPPKEAQFKKGLSGNPKGRPKGSKNLATTFLKESRQQIQVKVGGRNRTITKLQAAVTQLGNKAAQGDLRAQRELFFWIQRSEEMVGARQVPLTSEESDHRTMESLLERVRRAAANDSLEKTSTQEKPE